MNPEKFEAIFVVNSVLGLQRKEPDLKAENQELIDVLEYAQRKRADIPRCITYDWQRGVLEQVRGRGLQIQIADLLGSKRYPEMTIELARSIGENLAGQRLVSVKRANSGAVVSIDADMRFSSKLLHKIHTQLIENKKIGALSMYYDIFPGEGGPRVQQLFPDQRFINLMDVLEHVLDGVRQKHFYAMKPVALGAQRTRHAQPELRDLRQPLKGRASVIDGIYLRNEHRARAKYGIFGQQLHSTISKGIHTTKSFSYPAPNRLMASWLLQNPNIPKLGVGRTIRGRAKELLNNYSWVETPQKFLESVRSFFGTVFGTTSIEYKDFEKFLDETLQQEKDIHERRRDRILKKVADFFLIEPDSRKDWLSLQQQMAPSRVKFYLDKNPVDIPGIERSVTHIHRSRSSRRDPCL